MKLKRHLILICLFTLALFFQGKLNSQTLVVEPNNNLDSGIMPLNEIIRGDTMADGSRNNTRYELKNDGYYVLSGTLVANFDIELIGQDGAGSKPIVIMGATSTGGDAAWTRMNFTGNATIKNIRFPVINSGGGRGWNHLFAFLGSGKTLIMDNCVVDFNDGAISMNEDGADQTWIFTNNLFRWHGQEEWGGMWTGFGAMIKVVDVEKIYFENNTFVDVIAPIWIHETSHLKNFWFNHNTVVNHAQFLMRSEYWSQAVHMNNLFVNAHFAGETYNMRDGQDPDKLPYGVITVAAPANDSLAPGLPSSANRIFSVTHNNNFVSQEILDFWDWTKTNYHDSIDFKVADPANYMGLMNSRALAMMEDKQNFPMFHLDQIHTLDPGFTDFTFNFQGMINHAKSMHGFWSVDPDVIWGGHPSGRDMMLFPVPEDHFDLSYTNVELLTSGYAGYPLGDLNWFPDKKAQWEQDTERETYEKIIEMIKAGDWLTTSMDDYGRNGNDGGFALQQNFPNPAEKYTTIGFTIPHPTHVKLNIMNLLGQVAKELVNETLSDGSYQMQFDLSDLPSGLYVYQLETSGTRLSRKMYIVK